LSKTPCFSPKIAENWDHNIDLGSFVLQKNAIFPPKIAEFIYIITSLPDPEAEAGVSRGRVGAQVPRDDAVRGRISEPARKFFRRRTQEAEEEGHSQWKCLTPWSNKNNRVFVLLNFYVFYFP
jgi:hypothetical protein